MISSRHFASSAVPDNEKEQAYSKELQIVTSEYN
jgi:hypothetical protein